MAVFEAVTTFERDRIEREYRVKLRESLSDFAKAVRDEAVRLIQEADGPSAPGDPPHTHTGALPDAIQYYAGEIEAGGAFAADGGEIVRIALLLEYGGWERHGERLIYTAPRPFLRPAYERVSDRFFADFGDRLVKDRAALTL